MNSPRKSQLLKNLEQLRQTIERATARSGRPFGSVQLLAVTKSVPAPVVEDLIDLGTLQLGENRPETMGDRVRELGDAADQVTWHMIGHYQRRKVRSTLHYFGWVHSVHSEDLLLSLEQACPEDRAPLNVLLQVNPAGEEQKQGLMPAEIESVLSNVGRYPHLAIRGLMAMAPANCDSSRLRRIFAQVRAQRDALKSEELPLLELSMGMSQDFEEAILEGATMVRIGSAIFDGVL
jgi:pyridoxal phosphate enzyme (YggS family)